MRFRANCQPVRLFCARVPYAEGQDGLSGAVASITAWGVLCQTTVCRPATKSCDACTGRCWRRRVQDLHKGCESGGSRAHSKDASHPGVGRVEGLCRNKEPANRLATSVISFNPSPAPGAHHKQLSRRLRRLNQRSASTARLRAPQPAQRLNSLLLPLLFSPLSRSNAPGTISANSSK